MIKVLCYGYLLVKILLDSIIHGTTNGVGCDLIFKNLFSFLVGNCFVFGRTLFGIKVSMEWQIGGEDSQFLNGR
jgi:hypothetical protein